MKQIYLSITLVCFTALCATAQINYNANDPAHVIPYTSPFLYGSNMGIYSGWTSQTIADIAAGNASKNVKGAGVKSLHLPITDEQVTLYGYDVFASDYTHYSSLGIKDNTVWLEAPASGHKDNTIYPGCTQPSLIWSNIYLPIWDNGENNTPVNDNNYLAVYVYNTVMHYKSWVKFWELVNEPDFDGGVTGWKDPGDNSGTGNWWDRNPTAGELSNLRAPLYSYIRMLHVAYEVIKSVDPNAYVSMGGVGYPSFLDALLRNTENPVDGSVTADYPYKGGAWIDCLSFHFYPIYEIGAKRHSDAGVDVYLRRKHLLDSVLQARGYDGVTYPKKVFINTENNIPRYPIAGYPGGEDLQRNYDMKALIASQLNDIRQFYIFSIGDDLSDGVPASNPFNFVGLYKNLNVVTPISNAQQYNPSGIAYKTVSDALSGFSADLDRTTAMALPAGVRGGAFKNSIGDYKYVLWAATTIDNSEVASATYSFPGAINMPAQIYQQSWDYFQTNSAPLISSQNIALTGTPIIVYSPLIVTALKPDTARSNPVTNFSYALYPNPVKDRLTVRLHLTQRQNVSIKITDGMGQLLSIVTDNKLYDTGDNFINITLPSRISAGLYYCRMLIGGNREETIKFIVTK